jgi:hypothetical protein
MRLINVGSISIDSLEFKLTYIFHEIDLFHLCVVSRYNFKKIARLYDL